MVLMDCKALRRPPQLQMADRLDCQGRLCHPSMVLMGCKALRRPPHLQMADRLDCQGKSEEFDKQQKQSSLLWSCRCRRKCQSSRHSPNIDWNKLHDLPYL